MRSRGRRSSVRAHTSNFKDTTVKGTALQISEKYKNLEKEALANQDQILADHYAQHSDHWERVWKDEKISNCSE